MKRFRRQLALEKENVKLHPELMSKPIDSRLSTSLPSKISSASPSETGPSNPASPTNNSKTAKEGKARSQGGKKESTFRPCPDSMRP